jgi:hypothetical protein
LSASLEPHAIIDPAKPDLGEGCMVDASWQAKLTRSATPMMDTRLPSCYLSLSS